MCVEYLRTYSSYLGKFSLKIIFYFVKAILVKWNRVVSKPGDSFRQKKKKKVGSLQPEKHGSKYVLVYAALFLVLLGFISFSLVLLSFCFLRTPLCPALSNPGEQGEPRELKCVHKNQSLYPLSLQTEITPLSLSDKLGEGSRDKRPGSKSASELFVTLLTLKGRSGEASGSWPQAGRLASLPKVLLFFFPQGLGRLGVWGPSLSGQILPV